MKFKIQGIKNTSLNNFYNILKNYFELILLYILYILLLHFIQMIKHHLKWKLPK